jgi:hypothetical protein
MGEKLAVVVPSRGLIFSETYEELLRELEGIEHELFFAHGLPIPQCFEEPTDRALADPEVFAILYCEDDMILPRGGIREMFAQNYPVVAYDYPFKSNGDSTMLHDPEGNAYWSGCGLLLVARTVLEQMQKPIWRTDTTWDVLIKNTRIMFWPRKLKMVAYGLQDVNFGMLLYSAGVPISPMERTAGQRKLTKYVRNPKRPHEIKELTRVGRDLVIKTMDYDKIQRFKKVLATVGSAEIMDHIPDFVGYRDGQAYIKDQDYETV